MSDDEKMQAELLQELSDCRGDERNTANQMLSVIGAAGAILGVILTANIFSQNGSDEDTLEMILRVSFVLSNLIFCTAFSYAITLGVSAVMRYHYIRDLEDRLHRLHKDMNNQGESENFVHWISYSSAFVTRNYKHVKGVNGWFYYIAYTVATICASAFCVGVTISLFWMLSDCREEKDYVLLVCPILVMLLTVVAFLVTSSKADAESKLCFETAMARRGMREKRAKKTAENKTWVTPRLLLYLVYPKTKDIQKSMLTPLGYCLTTLWIVNSTSLEKNFEALKNNASSLLGAMFIFDFLFYQARYQINDLRGLNEDRYKKKTPIPGMKDADNRTKRHIICASIIIALIRIIGGCAALWLVPVKNKDGLLICVGSLVVITVLYEWIRKVKKSRKDWINRLITFLIFTLVGLGYPLRFLVGAMMAENFCWDDSLTATLLALYFYGLVMVIVLWNLEMEKISCNSGEPVVWTKLHYEVMARYPSWTKFWVRVFALISSMELLWPIFKRIELLRSQLFCAVVLILMILGSYVVLWVKMWPKSDLVSKWCKKGLRITLEILLTKEIATLYLTMPEEQKGRRTS